MCFWIFHDWAERTSYGCQVRRFKGDWSPTVFAIGLECRKCGRRKINCVQEFKEPEAYAEALNWLKEEVIK